MFKFFNKKRKRRNDFDASETFIDSKNLAGFDENKFDGVLERPLGKMSFLGIFFVFIFVLVIFLGKAFYMQIIQGEDYLVRSIGNFKKSSVLFSERGVIFDRNGKELVWNEKNIEDNFSKRVYINKIGFSHILGFLSYPQSDRSGNFFEKEYVGKAGVEKYFNEELNGKLGKKIIEINSVGEIISENKKELPEAGENIYLSIDLDIQKSMAYHLNDFITKYHFDGGAAVLMNIKTGEIIASISLPEYDSNILTNGKEKDVIKSYVFDKNNPFLNRVALGEFTPGSIVKPYIALRALKDDLIDPNEKIYTNGQIVIPNRYYPDNPSIFRDYKNNGIIDMKKALAVSSNIYFYILGGGFEEREGMGINKLSENFKDFGFGEETGIFEMKEKEGLVPSIEWKKEVFGTNWNIGNTYYTAIGQFGFLTTPLQIVTAISSIANNGELLVPKMIKDSEKEIKRELEFDDKSYKIIKEGMREAVLMGTAQLLNIPEIKIAAKSGTAERGINRDRVNSWITGFFPYDDPKYAFVFLAENGHSERLYVVSYAAHQFFKETSKDGSLERLLNE